MEQHVEAIKAAETVHAELVARLAAAREALATNGARRHSLAFAAETGDADARREVATLAKAAASLKDNIEHGLAHAVEQAAQRITAARLDADAEAKRQAAVKVRAVAKRAEARGAELEALVDQIHEIYAAFQDDLVEMSRLGAPGPSTRLVESNSRRALDAALSGIHNKARAVRPSQRHPFSELLHGWTRPALRWAAQILDAPASHKDAA